jgi:hypothetical protein
MVRLQGLGEPTGRHGDLPKRQGEPLGAMVTLHGATVSLHGDLASLHVTKVTLLGAMVSIHGAMMSLQGNLISLHGATVSIHGAMMSIHGAMMSLQGDLVSLRGATVTVSLCYAMVMPQPWKRVYHRSAAIKIPVLQHALQRLLLFLQQLLMRNNHTCTGI